MAVLFDALGDQEVFGMTIKEKCEAHGISYHVYHDRIRRGWPEEEALGVKPHAYKFRPKHEAFGKKQTLREWAAETGIGWKLLYHRLRRGMSMEEAINAGKHRPSPYMTTFRGEPIPIAELARRCGMSYGLLKYRVLVMGLSGDEAISRPITRGGYRGWKKEKTEAKLKGSKTNRPCGHDDCFSCPYDDCIA